MQNDMHVLAVGKNQTLDTEMEIFGDNFFIRIFRPVPMKSPAISISDFDQAIGNQTCAFFSGSETLFGQNGGQSPLPAANPDAFALSALKAPWYRAEPKK